jgi:hypothetical protein
MKSFAIVGSRTFSNFEVFIKVINEIISLEGKPKTIISGGAIGADTLAYNWALENKIKIIVFEPKRDDFPKNLKWLAAKERNTKIVDNSDLVLALWDMKSTGTKDTIDKALKKGIKVYVYDILSDRLLANYS